MPKYAKIFLDATIKPTDTTGKKWLLIKNYNDFKKCIIFDGLPWEMSFGFISDGDKTIPPSRIAKFVIGYSMRHGYDLSHMGWEVHADSKIEEDKIMNLFNDYYTYYNIKKW